MRNLSFILCFFFLFFSHPNFAADNRASFSKTQSIDSKLIRLISLCSIKQHPMTILGVTLIKDKDKARVAKKFSDYLEQFISCYEEFLIFAQEKEQTKQKALEDTCSLDSIYIKKEKELADAKLCIEQIKGQLEGWRKQTVQNPAPTQQIELPVVEDQESPAELDKTAETGEVDYSEDASNVVESAKKASPKKTKKNWRGKIHRFFRRLFLEPYFEERTIQELRDEFSKRSSWQDIDGPFF